MLLGLALSVRARLQRAGVDQTAALGDAPVTVLSVAAVVAATYGRYRVVLRLRYLVHPKRGQRVRNELYETVLERFNEGPGRVEFPVGRNR